MKKRAFLFITIFYAAIVSFAQIDKMKEVLDDEMDTEHFTLRFVNALNGLPVEDATVQLDDIGKFLTDMDGKIKFPRTEDGQVGVHFKADGYIPTDVFVEVVAGSIFNNHISVSPEMAMEYFRIILDWNRHPRDLDEHLTKDNDYHISYRNMKVSDDGVATLDRDDTDSFGPETITVKEIATDGHYTFWVQDFTNRDNSNSKALSKSGATVKVYGNGELLQVITVPADQRGNKWNVFEIVDGKIQLTNYISSRE
jgi:hypothetical protein